MIDSCIYNNFSEEFNSSFFGNSCDEEYPFVLGQQVDFKELPNMCQMNGPRASDEIPFELYNGYNFENKHPMDSYKSNSSEESSEEESFEISSVKGEKDYQDKQSL